MLWQPLSREKLIRKIIAMRRYFLVIILLVALIIEASFGDFSLTSDLNLEGATVSPGYVQLLCNATSIRTDVVRWFFGNSTEYANRAIEQNEILPQVVPVLTTNPIPGVEIVLTKSSINAEYQYTSYESTLTVNLSVFNVMERLSFKCGSLSQESNTIALNFGVEASFGGFSLTSDLNLEGATVCPGYVQLLCNATSIRTDVVRWFFGNSTEYANRAIEQNEILPQVVPVLTTNPIPGVEIVLTKSSINAEYQYTSYESTLTVNLSVFNVMERLSFKCGSLSQESNTIALNFGVEAPQDQSSNQLIALYNSSYQLISVTATWRQPISRLCPGVFFYNISLRRNGNFEDEKFIRCSNTTCSAEFQIDSAQYQSEDMFSVSIRFGDRFNHYNRSYSAFSETFEASISNSLNFSVTEEDCTTRLHCSLNEIGCMIQYSQDPLYEDLGPPLVIPLNGLDIHRQSTADYFQITVNTETTLKILFQGVFIRTELELPPSPSSATCSLIRTTGGPEVSIQWSPSFTSQYVVEMYHVEVNPATPSCSSNQTMKSNESYRCSGLVLGTHYSFSVSAINCVNEEGDIDNFMIQLRAPADVIVFPEYDLDGQLDKMTVQWMRQTDFSDKCSFNQLLNYTVVLGGSTRERVDQRMISSDNCSNNLCSISFPSFFSNQSDPSYFVRVNVTGAFGSSSTSTSLNASSIPPFFDISFSSAGCMTSVLCSYSKRGEYFFQYGRDSSYRDLSPSLSATFNYYLQINLSDSDTIYYYQVTVSTSSLNFRIRGNFTSGKGPRLTSTNQGLVVVGVIALISVVIILAVTITWMLIHKGPWLSLGLAVTGFSLALVSLVLWIATGLYVALQKNTCDASWQSSIDKLVISAHVFSGISFLITIGGLLFAVAHNKLKGHGYDPSLASSGPRAGRYKTNNNQIHDGSSSSHASLTMMDMMKK